MRWIADRWFTPCLALVTLVGALAAVSTGRERQRLEAQHRRVTRWVGDLPVEDPTRVTLRALETGEPGHFAWRIHLTPKYRLVVRKSQGGWSSNSSTEATEFLAHVRFRNGQDKNVDVYTSFSSESLRSWMGGTPLADALRNGLRGLTIEQAGVKGIETHGVDEGFTLLRVALPPENGGRKSKGSDVDLSREFSVSIDPQGSPP